MHAGHQVITIKFNGEGRGGERENIVRSDWSIKLYRIPGT